MLLFWTGFGATNPVVPSLSYFEGAAPLVSTLRLRIGGVDANVRFGGLCGAELYQVNVIVPDLPDGDYRIEGDIGGKALVGERSLTVKR